MLSNISKFSFAEIFSNENGKSSGTAFCGIIICLTGSLCFLLGCIDKMFFSNTIDIITQTIIFVGIGATLMGVRRLAGTQTNSNDSSEAEKTNGTEEAEMIKS